MTIFNLLALYIAGAALTAFAWSWADCSDDQSYFVGLLWPVLLPVAVIMLAGWAIIELSACAARRLRNAWNKRHG